jgi:hypothetical protein
MAFTLISKIRNNRAITDIERTQGESILNFIAENNPELFFDMDDLFVEDKDNMNFEEVEITIDLVERIVKWDRLNRKLEDYKHRFMIDLLNGKKALDDRNKFIVRLNLKTIKKYGFR